jgi:hypothetical protein
MNAITDRVERELGMPGLAALLAEQLDPSDLQSLLLDVYQRAAKARSTTAMLEDYTTNRFVRPSKLSPSALLEWDRVAFSRLPPGCEAVELSPVCPLGVSAVMAGLAQDRVLSTVRNTEVVSDSTNVMALEAAVRRRVLKRAEPRSRTPVHLACSHRLLRTQKYNSPALSSHFRVFSLCSAGRDRGSYGFETDALSLQISFYLSAIGEFLANALPLRVTVTLLDSGTTLRRKADEVVRQLGAAFPRTEIVFDPMRSAGREYYRTMCFWILGMTGDEPVHLVDGGFVDWTQRLLSDAKERLLVSGVGSERVCTLRATLSRTAAGPDAQ